MVKCFCMKQIIITQIKMHKREQAALKRRIKRSVFHVSQKMVLIFNVAAVSNTVAVSAQKLTNSIYLFRTLKIKKPLPMHRLIYAKYVRESSI